MHPTTTFSPSEAPGSVLSFLPQSPEDRRSFVESVCGAAWAASVPALGAPRRPDHFNLVDEIIAKIMFLRELLRIAGESSVRADELPSFLSLACLPSALRFASPHRKAIPRWPDLGWVRRGKRGKQGVAEKTAMLALEEEDPFWLERAAGADVPAGATWEQRLAPGYSGTAAESCYSILLEPLLPAGLLFARRPRVGVATPRPRRATATVPRFWLTIGFLPAGDEMDPMSWPAGRVDIGGVRLQRVIRIRITLRRGTVIAHGSIAAVETGDEADALRARAGEQGTRVAPASAPPEWILKSVYLLRSPAEAPFPTFSGTRFCDLREVLPIDATPPAMEIMLAISLARSALRLHARDSGGGARARRAPAPGVLSSAELAALRRKIQRCCLALTDRGDAREIVAPGLGDLPDLLLRDQGHPRVPWLNRDSLDAFLRPRVADGSAAAERPVEYLHPADAVLEGETAAARAARAAAFHVAGGDDDG